MGLVSFVLCLIIIAYQKKKKEAAAAHDLANDVWAQSHSHHSSYCQHLTTDTCPI